MALAVAPPIIKIGPPPAKATGGIAGKLDTMLKAHGPAWRQYEGFILKWAGVYKVDPLYIASVLLTENASANAGAKSSAGAIGPAQILDQSINPNLNPNAVWDGPAVLSAQWKQNFNNAIKYVAWRMAGQIPARGGLDKAYAGGYNTTAYTGLPPSHFLPKGYVPTTGPGTQATAAEGAGASVAGTQARHTLTDPWVVVTPKGGLKTITATAAPKNAVTDATGQALTLSQFNTVARSLDSIYLAYTGVRANPSAVARYIKNPVSSYEIQQRLSDPKLNPRFYKSPVWLTHAPDYEAVYKGVFGNDAKTSDPNVRKLIAYGVVHNLSQAAFQQQLRNLPTYSTSEEYKGAAAQFRGAYEGIYGTPDVVGEQHIDAAVKKGWNTDQWTQFLRNQPEYTASGEFQRNATQLMARLGFSAPGMTTPLTSAGPVAASPAPSLAATGSAPSG